MNLGMASSSRRALAHFCSRLSSLAETTLLSPPTPWGSGCVSSSGLTRRAAPPEWLPLSRLVDLVSQMPFLDDARDGPRVYPETVTVVKETLQMTS